MHEQSLMADLMSKINTISQQQHPKNIIRVNVKLGALAHISADHFKEHFIQAAKGTSVENTELDVEVLTDINDPQAQEILLDSVDVEE